MDCINKDDPTEYACVRMHSVSDDGKEYEMRACSVKSICEEQKKKCEDKAQLKALGLKECTITCCVSDGDTPCNGGFSVFINSTGDTPFNGGFSVFINSTTMMMMMMLAVLCTLKLF